MPAAERKTPQAVILAGASREENLGAARRLAAEILCEGSGAAPCGRCRACRKIEAGIHPDLILVQRQADDKGRLRREITVDQLRELSRDAWVLPNEAARKVYVIDEADKMNAAAQNAALKLLEEPPNGAVFLLCAANPALLLPTVRSRCAERRAGLGEDRPEESSRKLAEELVRTAAAGDRAALLRWCVAQEEMDLRETQSFIEALRLQLADLLCLRRAEPGLSREQLAAFSALAARCADYLRVNTGVKHIFGLLAVDTPLGSGNRGKSID